VGEKTIADRGSPGLDQLALAHLMRSGRYDRHLRTMRGVYRERRDALVEALAEHAPEVVVSGLSAGFHAVLRLPDHRVEQDVVAAARARGIGLYAMGEWRSDSTGAPPELIVGFGAVTPQAIRQAVATIADLLR
jgi:GntR family transcriptional regulator/MocR family aminotransferase